MKTVTISERKLKRFFRAERVCQELRSQMSARSYDEHKLFDLLMSWMTLAGKAKYQKGGP